jgi:hypothetical protein
MVNAASRSCSLASSAARRVTGQRQAAAQTHHGTDGLRLRRRAIGADHTAQQRGAGLVVKRPELDEARAVHRQSSDPPPRRDSNCVASDDFPAPPGPLITTIASRRTGSYSSAACCKAASSCARPVKCAAATGSCAGSGIRADSGGVMVKVDAALDTPGLHRRSVHDTAELVGRRIATQGLPAATHLRFFHLKLNFRDHNA